MKNTQKKLYELLSNVFSVYVKTLCYHWNVTGSNFTELHELFGKHYEALAESMDELAERLRALDVVVDGTIGGFDKARSLKDAGLKLNSTKMLQDLVSDYTKLVKMEREVLKSASKEGDEVTVDLMVQTMAEHEKTLWMLKAYLA